MAFAETLQQAGVEANLLLIRGADHEAIIRSEQSLEAVEDFLATLAEASTSGVGVIAFFSERDGNDEITSRPPPAGRMPTGAADET
jgi:hypothetical protein